MLAKLTDWYVFYTLRYDSRLAATATVFPALTIQDPQEREWAMQKGDASSAGDAKMRGVLLAGYGGIEMLEYRNDLPVPTPQPGEVLIRVGACGINNTDINLRTGWYNRDHNTAVSEDVGLNGAGLRISAQDGNSWNQSKVGFPRIQGAAIVGTVEASSTENDSRLGKRVVVDPQVRDSSMPERAQLIEYLGGDRDGGFAEYVAVPGANVYLIESDLSDAELATFPTSYDTAEEMLVRTKLAKGEVIVITGAAGGVGTALIQLSLIRGAHIIAIASADKEAEIRQLGANDFIPRDHADIKAEVESIVGTEGVHVFADVVGGQMFEPLLKCLGRGGRYATAGAIAGPIQPFDLRDLIYKDLEMHGITCPTPKTFESVLKYVTTGQLKPILAKVFPLSELRAAQQEFIKRRHIGKFVITP